MTLQIVPADEVKEGEAVWYFQSREDAEKWRGRTPDERAAVHEEYRHGPTSPMLASERARYAGYMFAVVDRPPPPATKPSGDGPVVDEPPMFWTVVFPHSQTGEAVATDLHYTEQAATEARDRFYQRGTVIPLYRKVDAPLAAAIHTLPDVAPRETCRSYNPAGCTQREDGTPIAPTACWTCGAEKVAHDRWLAHALPTATEPARSHVSAALCGAYLGDNDATCPQLTCIRPRGHEGDHDNTCGDDAGATPAAVDLDDVRGALATLEHWYASAGITASHLFIAAIGTERRFNGGIGPGDKEALAKVEAEIGAIDILRNAAPLLVAEIERLRAVAEDWTGSCLRADAGIRARDATIASQSTRIAALELLLAQVRGEGEP